MIWKNDAGSAILLKVEVFFRMLRILLLEDSDADQELIQNALNTQGIQHESFWARTKEMFAARLNHVPLDVVLCDSGGVNFKGKEALEMVRDRQPQAVFIFLTGHTSGPVFEALKQSGADSVLSKTDLPLVGQTITHALRAKGRDLK